MFGALKRGRFRNLASLILVNVVGELQQKRTLAASRGFLAAARLSCSLILMHRRIHLLHFVVQQRKHYRVCVRAHGPRANRTRLRYFQSSLISISKLYLPYVY